MMLYHHAKFGYRRLSTWGDIVQMNIHWNSAPLLWPWPWPETAVQSFHKTIHLMMMCHQTKFSCKKISSSEDILKSHILIIWSFTVTLTLKTTNKSFWRQSGSWWCITTPSLVVKCSVIQKTSSGQTLTFWHFAVTLTLNTATQFLHKTLWPIILYYQTKFGSKRISSSEDAVEIVIFWK